MPEVHYQHPGTWFGDCMPLYAPTYHAAGRPPTASTATCSVGCRPWWVTRTAARRSGGTLVVHQILQRPDGSLGVASAPGIAARSAAQPVTALSDEARTAAASTGRELRLARAPTAPRCCRRPGR